ncbi:MAG: hypothetical protein EP330_12855 [Deltaproteobacteria bacterium]|nr:MAG: hypothetical protein EP330_12855 [Deltaproteobacteria bacterium]
MSDAFAPPDGDTDLDLYGVVVRSESYRALDRGRREAVAHLCRLPPAHADALTASGLPLVVRMAPSAEEAGFLAAVLKAGTGLPVRAEVPPSLASTLAIPLVCAGFAAVLCLEAFEDRFLSIGEALLFIAIAIVPPVASTVALRRRRHSHVLPTALAEQQSRLPLRDPGTARGAAWLGQQGAHLAAEPPGSPAWAQRLMALADAHLHARQIELARRCALLGLARCPEHQGFAGILATTERKSGVQ